MATITGNGGKNTLNGTEDPDTISGLGNDDTLNGLGGNDYLDGGTGSDAMSGGTGNDTFIVDDAGDVVTETAGEGIDLVQSSITYTLTANVENLALTGTAGIGGGGNALDNIINGNSGVNILFGEAGNDILNGHGGNDVINGGDGNDKLAGNDGNDTLDGGANDDRIGGQDGNDTMDGGSGTDLLDYTSATAGVTVSLAVAGAQNTGGAGTDTISNFESLYGSAHDDALTGDGGANVLVGFAGNDVLDGGAGNDGMYGGLGNDTYSVDAVGDITSDAGGTDTILSSVSLSLAYRPTIENLTLTGTAVNGFGSAGANIITGNAAANVLSGADGADTLVGGGGADKLYGGTGADIFGYAALADSSADFAGRDVIYDFVEGEDVIDLAALDADAGSGGDQAFTFIGTAAFTGAGQLRYDVGSGGVVVYANVDGDLGADFSIRIAGTYPGLTAAAFDL